MSRAAEVMKHLDAIADKGYREQADDLRKMGRPVLTAQAAKVASKTGDGSVCNPAPGKMARLHTKDYRKPGKQYNEHSDNATLSSAWLQFLRAMEEGDSNAVSDDDTIIKNVTDPQWQCPTCGYAFKGGMSNISLINCPGCNHGAELAQGGVQYRTTSGNMKRADGRTGLSDYK